jgi:neutral trehalase
MLRASYQPNDIYKYRRIKIRTTILETIYKKPSISMSSERHGNDRLRFRFREAIREAEEICEENKRCRECYEAWYEVDELEDSLMRLGEEVIQENSMRYGSVLRRNFKLRWGVKNVEDHHVIPRQFRKHPVIKYLRYDVNDGKNIIMMPRYITPGMRENRLTHRGGHKKYNQYVGKILDSLDELEDPKKDFELFTEFLKTACRFRPQDIPWK